MAARTKLTLEEQMTIEEFLAFTGTRPEEERWELIEGAPVMNPSPIDDHQTIVANVITALMVHRRQAGANWRPMPGIGTRVPISPRSLPQPDVLVKEEANTGSPVTDDALILFEVLSRSNSKRDQEWRRKVYASVPTCQHYVTVSLKAVEVAAYDRSTGWEKRTLTGLSDSLDLPALGLSIPLADIYADTVLVSRGKP
jgi:Uma2 family endonuclease